MRPQSTGYNQEQAWGGVRCALVISAGQAGTVCAQLPRVPVKECESSGKYRPTHQPPSVLGELAVGSGWVWGAPPTLRKAGLPGELWHGDTGIAFCLPLPCDSSQESHSQPPGKGCFLPERVLMDRSGYDLRFKDSTFQQSHGHACARTHTHTHTHTHTPSFRHLSKHSRRTRPLSKTRVC